MTGPYATPRAFQSALKEALKRASAESGHSYEKLNQRFLLDRVLARVFHPSTGGNFILKGGMGMVVRLFPQARFSRDLDLSYRGTVAEAVEELRAALRIPLNDHLSFTVGNPRAMHGGQDSATVTIAAALGTKAFGSTPIDLIVGRPDIRSDLITPTAMYEISGIELPPAIHVLSVETQTAQKICAMYEFHGTNRAVVSTRFRDLIDLVLIVDNCDLDAATVTRILEIEVAERAGRGYRVALPPALRSPGPPWERGYRAAAGDAGVLPAELQTLAAAIAHAGRCLDPILSGERGRGRWDHRQQRWLDG